MVLFVLAVTEGQAVVELLADRFLDHFDGFTIWLRPANPPLDAAAATA
ncbi:hypothetical protein [Microbacterium sp. 67-17]|nr:hypothetical protein [Microbacterium sp. 67-17]